MKRQQHPAADRWPSASAMANAAIPRLSEVVMPWRSILVFIIMAGIGALGGRVLRADEPPVYEAYAIRYATLLGYPVASLVQGADRARKLDLAMMFWVLKGPGGQTVLVDSGFYRPRNMKRTDIADYVRPDKALSRLGIKPKKSPI